MLGRDYVLPIEALGTAWKSNATRGEQAQRRVKRSIPQFMPAVAAVAAIATASAATAPLPASPLLFDRDVRPIFSDTCYPCHGFDANKRKANLRLDTPEGIVSVIEGRQVVKPGDLTASELWRRVNATDPKLQMPPPESGKKLTPSQVEVLGKWITEGAPYQKHWSLEAPVRPELPSVKHAGWARNDIDRFILATLETKGLSPATEAPKVTLIRRATLALTGLPPSLPEIEAFLADTETGAYERAVDRLLSSPRYGEHMARYWLDAARYGDTHGLHLDNERSLWPYRDWVVGAFNRNLPFDQFTVWQLAGDLLPNPTREQLVASGFNRCNVSTSEGGAIDEEFQVRYAIDRVETTSTVWMGLTMGCAVCHDHKLDPITQKEFYEVFSIFNNIAENAMDGNALLPPPILKLPTPEQQTRAAELDQRLSELEKKVKVTVSGLQYSDPAMPPNSSQADGKARSNGTEAASVPKPTEDPNLSLLAWIKKERALGDKSPAPPEIRELLKRDSGELAEAQGDKLRQYYLEHVFSDATLGPLRNELKGLRDQRAALEKEVPATMISKELDKPRPSWVLIRGQYDKKGDPVGPGVPAVLPPLPQSEVTNRLTFARWLVDPRHPLTARVTVNRLWQQVFGTGIVKTSEDFGNKGEWPSHPELLDWFATEFMRTGWDVKAMMRLMVTSATFRQSSEVTPALNAIDPENRLLARGPRYRLDAEVIRDEALFASGLLRLREGGRGDRPYQPPGIWEAVGYTTSNTAKYTQDHGEALYRRSLYLFWKRTAPPPLMTTLDAPSREKCTARRERTNTPLQALLTMNATQFFESARNLGYRMFAEGGATDADRLNYGFRIVTSRTPTTKEEAILERTLAAERAFYRTKPDAASQVCSTGESPVPGNVQPTELAAYTVIANLLLNLDEALTLN